MSRQQIAQELHISESNVTTSLSGIYRKFSIASDVGRGKENHLRDYLTSEYSKWANSNPGTVESQPLEIDQIVQQARSQIQPYIHKRCGTMRVLDMEQPIALTGEQSIYTRVNILEKITGRRRLGLADLFQNVDWEEFDRAGLTSITEQRIPGLDAVQRYPKLIVLGKPGAGKTTFLKFLAMQCINGQILTDHVPFFVTLKDFAEADDRPDLLGYCDRLVDLPTVRAIRESPLHPIVQSGRAVMILDGLDEVREEDTDRVLRQIQHVAERFPDNQFVITCRIAAKEYTSRFEQFTEVEVADFDDEQIAIFVNNWFRCKEPDRAEEWATLMLEQLEANEPIKELATNPLLLTLLCLEFEETLEFPSNRSELYDRGVRVLLSKWDASRRIKRDQVYKKLSLNCKEDLLSRIALTTFEQKDYFFKQRTVEAYIRDYIQNLPDAQTDPDALQLDSEAVLKSIESQHGLLVERARGIYSFSHLTFHEYFAAREIVLASRASVGAIRESPLQELVNH
jgi:predicted NACHT family NTPase